MTAVADPQVTPTPVDDDPDVGHYTCQCTDDVSLCGANVTGVPWAHLTNDGIPICVMCADMINKPCPRCGLIPRWEDYL